MSDFNKYTINTDHCVSTTLISFTCRHENEFGKNEMFVSYNL